MTTVMEFYIGPCEKCIERLERISRITDDLITHQDISLFVLHIMMYGRNTNNYNALCESLFVSRPLGYNNLLGRLWSWSDCYVEGILMPDENLMSKSKFYRVKLRPERTYYLDSMYLIEIFHEKYTEINDFTIGERIIKWNKLIEDGYGAIGTSGTINKVTSMNTEERMKYKWFNTFSTSGFIVLDPRSIKEYNVIIEDENYIVP